MARICNRCFSPDEGCSMQPKYRLTVKKTFVVFNCDCYDTNEVKPVIERNKQAQSENLKICPERAV